MSMYYCICVGGIIWQLLTICVWIAIKDISVAFRWCKFYISLNPDIKFLRSVAIGGNMLSSNSHYIAGIFNIITVWTCFKFLKYVTIKMLFLAMFIMEDLYSNAFITVTCTQKVSLCQLSFYHKLINFNMDYVWLNIRILRVHKTAQNVSTIWASTHLTY